MGVQLKIELIYRHQLQTGDSGWNCVRWRVWACHDRRVDVSSLPPIPNPMPADSEVEDVEIAGYEYNIGRSLAAHTVNHPAK